MRAAQAREARIQAALKQLPEVATAKKRNGSKAEARSSTTDADARVMKMGDGGFALAFDGIKVVLAQTQQAEIFKMSLLAIPERTEKVGSTKLLMLMRLRYLPIKARLAWLLRS